MLRTDGRIERPSTIRGSRILSRVRLHGQGEATGGEEGPGKEGRQGQADHYPATLDARHDVQRQTDHHHLRRERKTQQMVDI